MLRRKPATGGIGPARSAARDRQGLIRRLHLLRMAGAASLAVLSLVVYAIDGYREVAFAALVAGMLSLSGLIWVTRPLTPRAFQLTLLFDTVVLGIWAWLMGGLSLGVGAIFAWVLLGAGLSVGARAVLWFTVISASGVVMLGVADLLFDTVAFQPDRVIFINLVFSAAVLFPIGYLVSSVGATLREAELVDRQSRLRLAELREMREEFLSRISFEMRTPLTSVKGFTSTVLEAWDTLSDEDKIRFLQIVNRQADRLTRLIQSMVDFAQLDSGTLRLLSEKINVADILGQVRAHALRAGEDVDIVVECEDHAWMIGDTDRVRDMLGDLLENAMTHGAGPIYVIARRSVGHVDVSVTDSGPGVPVEKADLLFERRIGAIAQVDTRKGLGLSLPLAKELCAAMGGSIRHVPSAEGASFVVSLPGAEPPPSRVEGAHVPLRLLHDFPLSRETGG